ncbi:PEBP-like protein [Pleurotus eryngii]|uniref:PEBP-like protein n=1 Tax=Pleurotus eryngii TaxID=5323 RepID=A0A9P6A8F1_PLEER|nr:PEBP-like protein [Pleurotus eryngii]
MRSPLALLLSLVAIVGARDSSLSAVKKVFDDANIPSDLSIKFSPRALLEVSLPQTVGDAITLSAGIQLPRNATAGPPSFRIIGARSRGPFVIAAVDPDAPTPQTPTASQIRHFLGGNFTRFRDTLTNSTPAVSEFRQPTPPAGSPAHRYIFLLFNQPPGFESQTTVTPTTSISLFNISSFAETVGLGNPIAGTFMLVAPDA